MTKNTRSITDQLKPRTLSFAIGLAVFASTSMQADTDYGPVMQGETLSKIVSENYLVSQYSDDVIMREIFRLNPESFISNNIGLLRQGVNLTLPDDVTIRQALAARGMSSTSASMSSMTSSPAPQQQSSNRIVSIQENLRNVERERDSLKATLARTQADLSSLNTRYATAQAKMTELEGKLESFESAPAQAEVPSNQSALEESLNQARLERKELSDQLAAKSTELNQANEALAGSTAKEADLTKQISELSALNTQQSETLVSLQEELDSAKASLSESAASLEQPQQSETTQSAALISAEITKQNLAKSNALVVEKDKQISELEDKVNSLEEQVETLASSAPVSDEATASPEVSPEPEVVSNNDEVISKLNAQIAGYQEEIQDLKAQNDELVNDLMNSPAPMDDMGAMDEIVELDPLAPNPIATDANTNFLSKPLTLPTWSALLALLALGLTTLLFLLGRRKQSELVENQSNDSGVVFKSGNLDNRDEDVEALRVPPRRDPSRVAILDPSMTGELVSKTSEASVEKPKAINTADDSEEASLKFAMAEAYIELEDTSAANMLLHEVLLEGSDQQKAAAERLMSSL
ncbi:hypothetical protein EOL70_01875 [Leucothrix sargassi]|nr:hypothetical protein EOL70_01875 [Leucothrix sargassi]